MSAGFKFFCKGDLEDKEVKDFAAKNIMLNSHRLLRQVTKQIEKNRILQELVEMDILRSDLMI